MSASQAQSLLIDIQSHIPKIRRGVVSTAKNWLISADTSLYINVGIASTVGPAGLEYMYLVLDKQNVLKEGARNEVRPFLVQ